jgi:hypothetical protein
VGTTARSWTFHSSPKVKLALLPALGLAVVAFATPAHAGSPGVSPPDPTVTLNDGTLPATETVAALDSVEVTSPTDTPSTPTEPAGDGSAAEASTAIETPVMTVPDGLEMPANKAIALAADTGIAATDPAQSPVQGPPVTDVAATPTAAISPKQADASEAAPPTAVRSVAEPVESHDAGQYHASLGQYHERSTDDDDGTSVRRTKVHSVAQLPVRNRRSQVLGHAPKLVQFVSRICADSDPESLLISVENSTAKTSWNGSQISSCIVDLTGLGAPVEGVAAPSPCAAYSQYQPASGQYQTPPCDDGLAEQPAPSVPAQAECIPFDVATATDQVLPTGIVIGTGSPMTCASSVPVPVASGSASSTSGGPAGGREAGAIPAFPASPISSPPLTEPAASETKPVESSSPKTRRIVRRAPTTGADHVLGVTVAQSSPASNKVVRPAARVTPAEKERLLSPSVLETRGSRTRLEALEAQRVGTPSGSRGSPSTLSESPWLTAAFVLLLFGLASFASALAGLPGMARPTVPRHLGLLVTSKGLSRHPRGRQTRRQRGIRYRD